MGSIFSKSDIKINIITNTNDNSVIQISLKKNNIEIKQIQDPSDDSFPMGASAKSDNYRLRSNSF